VWLPCWKSPGSHVGNFALKHFESVAPLLDAGIQSKGAAQIFFAAARFYSRALQMLEFEPEFAYLDLVTCGEILANHYDYQSSDLHDPEVVDLLQRISQQMPDGEKVARQVGSRLRMIKRRFVRMVANLVSEVFFDGSESSEEFGRLKPEGFSERVGAAYDLRSKYVHTGVNFGQWVLPIGRLMNEVQVGQPLLSDPKLSKIIGLAPSVLGMERIMRFCLLRFAHCECTPIDARLDRNG
jgi:hypothetical protein